MRRSRAAAIALAAAALALVPAARAMAPPPGDAVQGGQRRGFLVAYGGKTVGGFLFENPETPRPFVLGGAVGFWLGRLVGVELDVAYSPRFFGDADWLGTNCTATFSGHLIAGPAWSIRTHKVRLFALAGGGVMWSWIEGFGRLGPEHKTQGAVAAGGGIIYTFGGRLFARLEFRHVEGLGGDRGAWATIDKWTFDRVTAGLGLMF